ncbi:NAC transcription factor 32-like [Lotus japonicus]|uniref:NAC transcription factor 32-like n=1 Tax=Lotus japonicus TaxID=34305 RepID=UPI00258E5810|nr:NAC transcription factor 32-like [Lotus japonicus]
MTATSSSVSRKEFNPTDDELLQLFLYNKVHGKPLPDNANILEYDLYGETNPWEIWEEFGDSNSYGGKDLYFFTKLKKKLGASARSVRTIGLGSWESEGAGKIVVAHNKLLGMKKRFRFEKSGTIEDGKWNMHEYSLDSSLLTDSSAVNHVLCRFRKNFGNNTRKRSTSKQNMTDTTKRRTLALELAATTESFMFLLEFLSLSSFCKNSHYGTASTTHAQGAMDKKNNDNKISLGEDISQVPKIYTESRDKTEVVKTITADGDFTMSWPELFAMQLRLGCSIEEEEINMLPNTFCKDLLLENIDINFIDTSNNGDK